MVQFGQRCNGESYDLGGFRRIIFFVCDFWFVLLLTLFSRELSKLL